jgi:hypothetical protein
MANFSILPRRLALDELVSRLLDPAFAVCFRRQPAVAELPGHVSPTVLAMCGNRSAYVKRWRRHARRCAHCRMVFGFYGIRVD